MTVGTGDDPPSWSSGDEPEVRWINQDLRGRQPFDNHTLARSVVLVATVAAVVGGWWTFHRIEADVANAVTNHLQRIDPDHDITVVVDYRKASLSGELSKPMLRGDLERGLLDLSAVNSVELAVIGLTTSPSPRPPTTTTSPATAPPVTASRTTGAVPPTAARWTTTIAGANVRPVATTPEPADGPTSRPSWLATALPEILYLEWRDDEVHFAGRLADPSLASALIAAATEHGRADTQSLQTRTGTTALTIDRDAWRALLLALPGATSVEVRVTAEGTVARIEAIDPLRAAMFDLLTEAMGVSTVAVTIASDGGT